MWIDETISLDEFAGQPVLIRFESPTMVSTSPAWRLMM
jgi:hypothetical protein